MNVFLWMTFLLAIAKSISSDWELLSTGPWEPREGLMGCVYNDYVYLSGGRLSTSFGDNQENFFYNDVYRINGTCYYSSNKNENECSWELVTNNAPWRGRAYHIMFVHSNYMYIIGGQNYSNFLNDVWRSTDGINWSEILTNKYINKDLSNISDYSQFEQRAGLAAISYLDKYIYLMGGCELNPPNRELFNDVWVSADDGKTWKLLIENSNWKPRSGARIQIYNNILYLAAGEFGFSGITQYDDVWSLDLSSTTQYIENNINNDDDITMGSGLGLTSTSWVEVTKNPGWDKRSGHGFSIDATNGNFWIVAGYFDKHDLWLSKDYGNTWNLTRNDVFNCDKQSCGRYDFWSLIYENYLIIYGGDGDYTTYGGEYNETWRLDLSSY